jgi:hypothetical protein
MSPPSTVFHEQGELNMSRSRTHQVHAPRDKKMSIHISSEQLMTMDRAARREAQISQGTYVKGGVHGGDKHARNKRDRVERRKQERQWERGGDE